MLKVFLSSTFKDLVFERQAVEATIHRMSAEYVGMEHFGSFAEEPLVLCLMRVHAADVLVLALGNKYGFVPSEASISMTEAEYREAIKERMPVLTYLADEEAYSLAPDDDPRLTSLKEEVKRKQGVSWFTSPDDLAAKVASDLARDFGHMMSEVNSLKERVDELIAILEDRARMIRQDLQQHYHHRPVSEYLERFQRLHELHIDSLRNGRIIRAHEILSEIHRLSHDLDMEAFWTGERRRGSYMLDPNAYERGVLICAYVAGDMKRRSEKYPSYVGITRRFTRKPIHLTDIYKIILATR